MSSDRFGEVPLGNHEALRLALSRRSVLRWTGMAGASLLTTACGGGGESGGSGGGAASGGMVTIPTTPAPSQPSTPTPTATPTPAPITGRTQFGVNYPDLFHRFITYAAPFNPEEQLKALADRNIKLVRFVSCPQWARDWNLWNADPDRYLAALDRVFAAGDKYGVKLVPILMSAPYGLSDLKGEAFSAWGNPASATRRAFDAFIPMMVRRFRSCGSLYMWEKSNEMNAFANIPTGYTYYPPVDTAALNAARTTADNYTDRDIMNVNTRFAELVRMEDPKRPFESGSTLPNAFETRRSMGKSGRDDRNDFRVALAKTLAGGSTVLSVHLYDDICKQRFDDGSSFTEVAGICRSVADANSTKLFVGEFGVPKSDDASADRARFQRMIGEIRDSGADYACAWAYDYKYSNWNISAPDRSWMIDDIAAANG